jgi:hypothetical protein
MTGNGLAGTTRLPDASGSPIPESPDHPVGAVQRPRRNPGEHRPIRGRKRFKHALPATTRFRGGCGPFRKDGHEAAVDLKALPGIGAEIVLSIDGEL